MAGLPDAPKSSPDVTLDKVQETFGYNLETSDPGKISLLLAIAMDHSATDSPNKIYDIGIPYIVDKGPLYWVRRLHQGDYQPDVLMNNALILLYTKEAIPGKHEAAHQLLLLAADKGYWPAQYYVAERNMNDHLSMDYTRASPATSEIRTEALKSLAAQTMDYYKTCAKIGFAPCQFRIGFWLSNSETTLTDGIEMLREAINTTIKDTRYKGVLDGAVFLASQMIVYNADQIGLDDVVKDQYIKLHNTQLAQMNKDAQQARQQ